MTPRIKIIGIYVFVGLLSLAMVLYFQSLGDHVPDPEAGLATDLGKEEVELFFPIDEDLELTIQNGEEVKLSDIRGEVTVLAQFFAVCPHCAVRNGVELKALEERFGSDPDFRIVCITVDPAQDGVEQLAAYGEALGADPDRWWFASAGDEVKTHEYLEQVLKFFAIRERRDEVDIASNGRFAHDLGFLLIDRDFQVVGKWPLADARGAEAQARDPDLYDRLKEEMYDRIERELSKDDDESEQQESVAGTDAE